MTTCGTEYYRLTAEQIGLGTIEAIVGWRLLTQYTTHISRRICYGRDKY